MKNNSRNKQRKKDSTNCYTGKLEQWTDFNFEGTTEIYTMKEAKEEMKKHEEDCPERIFTVKKIYPEKYYRNYSSLK